MHIGEWKREIILTPKEEPIPQPVRAPEQEPERRQPAPPPERRREKEPVTP